MAEVIPVTPDMFEQVYPVLTGFHSKTRDEWRRLFTYEWPRSNDCVGYALSDQGRIVGFLGLVFSRRLINGQLVPWCNTSSWIVEEDYRNESMALVFPLMGLKDHTITNLSPSRTAARIFRTLGFKTLNERVIFIPPVPDPRTLWVKKPACLLDNASDILERVDAPLASIIRDHLPYRCHHLYLEDGNESCYVLYNRVIKKKRYRMNYIQYISHPALFRLHLNRILSKIVFTSRNPVVMVDERLVESVPLATGIAYTLPNAALYRSKTLEREQIDNLYSERFLIN